METKTELQNLRENLAEMIRNSSSNLENKLKLLKKQIEENSKRTEYQERSSRSQQRRTDLNIMVLKDIFIEGYSLKKNKRKLENSPCSDFDKENLGNTFNSHQSDKEYFSCQGIEKDKATDFNSHEKISKLEREVKKLRDLVKTKDQEIIELNQLLLEENEQFSRMQNVKRDQRQPDDVDDLSVVTEDLLESDPKKLLKRVRLLKLDEHELNENVLQLRSDVEKLEKEKIDSEKLVEELHQRLIELKRSISKEERRLGTPTKNSLQEEASGRRKPGDKNSQAYELGFKYGEKVENEEGEFSNYFILKRKFDEIQAFITRIAGLLSKAVQTSRGRHASPELKHAYFRSSNEKLSAIKDWLQASPSKTQIDKDSKRFYLKFKKRFEASRLFLSRNCPPIYFRTPPKFHGIYQRKMSMSFGRI